MINTTIKESIANALSDLGVNVITNVPGYGGSDVLTVYNEITNKRIPISFHEEVAYTISHSAAILGKRSAVLMKAHGMAKAANSAIDSLYTKVTAGFVCFIFEDYEGSHSDNIMEADQLLNGMSFPYIKAESNKIYDEVIKAYKYSEKTGFPVAILIDASKINDHIEYERKDGLKKSFQYKRDILSHVVHPLFADYQYKMLTARKHNVDQSKFAKPVLPEVPDELPDRYREAALKYQPFFDVFKQFKVGTVCGDTTSSSNYSLPPYDCIDIITYIGGSIPLAIGAYLAGQKHSWALTGDFGFIAAGHLGLLEAVNREVPIKIVIFNNKQAAATGGQKIDKKILIRLLAPFEKHTKHIHNATDPIEISEILDEAVSASELRIVVVNY